MNFALTAQKSRELDGYMIEVLKIPGIVLMENASLGVVREIENMLPHGKVCVFCGTGNNGGDGFAIARGLMARGYHVNVFLLGKIDSVRGDAAQNFEFIKVLDESLMVIEDEYSLSDAIDEAQDADIIVDAIFGTGLSREIEGIYKKTIDRINLLEGYKIAVDIPSGVCSDTGGILGTCVNADETVTFQYAKQGHYLYPGKSKCGKLKVVTIGVDDNAPIFDGEELCVYEYGDDGLALSPRKENSNKGDFGRLMIIAGSVGMAGAAVMCAKAAVKTGAGLTTVATVPFAANALAVGVPEAMSVLCEEKNGCISGNSLCEIMENAKNKNAILMGAGMRKSEDTKRILESVLKETDCIKVIDADGLNVLAENMEFLHEAKGEIVLTPHPKEFSRLCKKSVEEILKNPVLCAREFTREYDVTLVLKGAVTVISNSEEGESLVCGDVPGMAKGGSGDVLGGIIGAMCAQGQDAYSAALFGAYINMCAGKNAQNKKGEYSMTPMDTIEEIGGVMQKMTLCEDENAQDGFDGYFPLEDYLPESDFDEKN